MSPQSSHSNIPINDSISNLFTSFLYKFTSDLCRSRFSWPSHVPLFHLFDLIILRSPIHVICQSHLACQLFTITLFSSEIQFLWYFVPSRISCLVVSSVVSCPQQDFLFGGVHLKIFKGHLVFPIPMKWWNNLEPPNSILFITAS